MRETEIDWASFLPDDHTSDLVASAREHFASLTTTPITTLNDRAIAVDKVWPELIEHGYVSLGLPEDVDGFGTLKDSVAVMEAAGSALLPVPLLLNQICSHTLAACHLLSPLQVHTRTALHLHNDQTSLRAWDGVGAESLVSLREASHTSTVVSISKVTQPLGSEPYAVDPSRPVAIFAESQLELLTETTLEVPFDRMIALARILASADLIGVAQRALDLSVSHAKVRTQFGQVIGGFQGVKHPLADTHVAVEVARSLCFGATVSALADPFSDETLSLSILAKAAASEAAFQATSRTVQTLGAMGLTAESEASWLVRRARTTAPFLGDHRQLYSAAGRFLQKKEVVS